jgi:hypothetical protein
LLRIIKNTTILFGSRRRVESRFSRRWIWKLSIALCMSPENDISHIMGAVTMKVFKRFAGRRVLH